MASRSCWASVPWRLMGRSGWVARDRRLLRQDGDHLASLAGQEACDVHVAPPSGRRAGVDPRAGRRKRPVDADAAEPCGSVSVRPCTLERPPLYPRFVNARVLPATFVVGQFGLGTGSSCEPDEARGSQLCPAYSLYVERRWRPSNVAAAYRSRESEASGEMARTTWRSKLAQYQHVVLDASAEVSSAHASISRRQWRAVLRTRFWGTRG